MERMAENSSDEERNFESMPRQIPATGIQKTDIFANLTIDSFDTIVTLGTGTFGRVK